MLRTAVLASSLFTLSAHANISVFDDMLACHTSDSNPGFAVRIEQSGKLIYTGVAGLSDIKSKQVLKLDNVFQIGSVSKQFTAAAILQLVEKTNLHYLTRLEIL